MSDLRQSYRPVVETVQLGDLPVSVRIAGSGTPVLLLHGFPHTKDVWREVEPYLVAHGCQVVAPDLRGLGDSGRTPNGFDAQTLAMDQIRLLDTLSLEAAHVVGFDLGAAPAFVLAAAHSSRVLSLTIIEAIIGGLSGAEAFLTSGAPWWFGFHQAPGSLAQDLIEGNEDRYVRFFLALGTRSGIPEDLTQRFVDAYTGRDSLSAAFSHYRAMPANAQWNRVWSEHGKLAVPVTAIGASAVGDSLARQLGRVAEDFEGHLLADSGHIVPIDAPQDVARIVLATASRHSC